MANYQEARFKLANSQLNKLNSVAKIIDRITKKNFQDEELPHKLFLTTRQKTKTKIAFANCISTDITLSKALLSKIIQSGGVLC